MNFREIFLQKKGREIYFQVYTELHIEYKDLFEKQAQMVLERSGWELEKVINALAKQLEIKRERDGGSAGSSKSSSPTTGGDEAKSSGQQLGPAGGDKEKAGQDGGIPAIAECLAELEGNGSGVLDAITGSQDYEKFWKYMAQVQVRKKWAQSMLPEGHPMFDFS